MEQKKKKRHSAGQRFLRNIRLLLSDFFHLIFSPTLLKEIGFVKNILNE
jgi:hypothetical protein